jgi:hypothetical protein
MSVAGLIIDFSSRQRNKAASLETGGRGRKFLEIK